ncbi:WD repeat-containing protein 89 [Prorops nasuta]|uniref:WD repeat-containing protein 89 n=1 Tax=Prorops nasuta TaxID=863751 RepID=UPI0034CFD121
MAKIVESLKKLSVENSVCNGNIHNDRMLKKKNNFILAREEILSDNDNYALVVCGTQNDPEFRVAAALSDNSCVVYSIGESISHTTTLIHNESSIIGMKFSSSSKNILYMGTSDGIITVCDLRAKGRVIAEFKDNSDDGKLKPLTSFDISCDDKLLAGGTEHIGGDAFILFWDIRHSNSKANSKNNVLGGYWESHMDDITSLSFHSTKKDTLASGSTDGLINIFDLTQTSEDAALSYSLNTESSVDRIGWLNDDSLWCTTHTHCLQLWNCDGATPYGNFNRSSVGACQNEDPDSCYLVRVHSSNVFSHPFLIGGSSTAKGEHLRCLNIVNDSLDCCNIMLDNKQTVRDSWLHEKSACLITIGEGSLLNIWKPTDSPIIQQSAGHKLTAKMNSGKGRDKHHRTKPY